MKRNPKVLVLATSRKTRGGITSVIKAHEQGMQWKKFHCRWIETHRDGNNLRKLWYLFSALLEYCVLIVFYDAVHIHFSAPTSAKRKFVFFKIARFFNKKIFIHLHYGNQLEDYWNPIYNELFLKSDKCFVLSKSIKKIIESHIGKNCQIDVLYNPCPTIMPSLSANRQNYILFAGSIIPDKGYVDLIKAFALIATRHTDWRIVFAGNGEVEKGRLLSKELNIENQVQFLGWVNGEAKEKAFQEASIFCLPSYAEGFPMAVLDAWAYGLPVITTPVGGLTDILEHGVNAMVFEPGNIYDLKNSIITLIENENVRNNISLESIKLSTNLFSINNIAKKLDNLYSTINTVKT